MCMYIHIQTCIDVYILRNYVYTFFHIDIDFPKVQTPNRHRSKNTKPGSELGYHWHPRPGCQVGSEFFKARGKNHGKYNQKHISDIWWCVYLNQYHIFYNLIKHEYTQVWLFVNIIHIHLKFEVMLSHSGRIYHDKFLRGGRYILKLGKYLQADCIMRFPFENWVANRSQNVCTTCRVLVAQSSAIVWQSGRSEGCCKSPGQLTPTEPISCRIMASATTLW